MKIMPPPITPKFILDPCPDANGHFTVRPDNQTENGDTDAQPVATFYAKGTAERFLSEIAALPAVLKALENAHLRICNLVEFTGAPEAELPFLTSIRDEYAAALTLAGYKIEP